MKSALFLSLLALVSAAPLQERQSVDPNEDQMTYREYDKTKCPQLVFLYTRGTLQQGNMGKTPGPQVAQLLKARYGDKGVSVHGLDYAADLEHNFLPKGTTDAAIANMTALVTDIDSNCPSSSIVMGGYSQGGAVVHGAVEKLAPKHLKKIKAIVTFGDTRNAISGGKFGKFDPKRSLIICNDQDTICTNGTLSINKAHSDYKKHAEKAAQFMIEQVDKKEGKGNKD